MKVEVKNSATTGVDIYLYGDILSGTPSEYVTKQYPDDKAPMQIQKALDDANGQAVNFYINSGGGSVFGGQAIASMIKRYSGKTTAYIDGMCASIATVIAFATDEVFMSDSALFMYHKAWSVCFLYGNANEIKEQAGEQCKLLDKIDDTLIETYKAHAKNDDAFAVIEKGLKSGKDNWLNADETVAMFNITKYESAQPVAFAKSEFTQLPEKYVKATTKKDKVKAKFNADDFLFDF